MSDRNFSDKIAVLHNCVLVNNYLQNHVGYITPSYIKLYEVVAPFRDFLRSRSKYP